MVHGSPHRQPTSGRTCALFEFCHSETIMKYIKRYSLITDSVSESETDNGWQKVVKRIVNALFDLNISKLKPVNSSLYLMLFCSVFKETAHQFLTRFKRLRSIKKVLIKI